MNVNKENAPQSSAIHSNETRRHFTSSQSVTNGINAVTVAIILKHDLSTYGALSEVRL